MQVTFDGFWWADGPLANRTVQRELVLAWADAFPQDDLTVALRHGAPADDLPAHASIVRTRLWPHGLSNGAELGVLARRQGADLVIAHNYTARHPRAVTFVHDAMFGDHPEWFSRPERVYFARMLPGLRRARLTVTSTATEARRIERLAPHSAPVADIGLAVSTALVGADAVRPPDVPDDFALTVGRLNVRKNLEAVIRAAVASTSVTPSSPLLVVGSGEHSGVGANLPDQVRQHVAEGSVRFLGRIADAELAWLYTHAAVTLCLSLDEGFGLPALEAVQFGSPAVVSDIPVFAETVGRYARLVDPRADAAVLATTLDSAWGHHPDPAVRDRILARYSWRRSVERLREAVAPLV
ncbi:glycosyltransferase [Isoptericola sp. b441]|uniref:Glycosyltransferase n=1 Tax=Actinotalea lenta TaxID=3064654 RepID=A0ABT9D7H4_9CELL|nr:MULTISPECIES: glycosyltransferase [unclassified Isoptericola]MDO8106799.1 glycosyltransferase [Isoptericola sp. b441]MDO8121490.1 glycosyltransferase [Isoptericola sp. b490]